MKSNFFLPFFSLIFILSFGSFESVFATHCQKLTACERFAESDLIFVGKYKKVSSSFKTEGRLLSDNHHNPFEVSEIFLGSKEDKIGIISFPSMPGSTLVDDATYLVFARKNSQNEFVTGMCSIFPIENAKEDLKFLRNIPSQLRQTSKIAGNVITAASNWDYKNLLIKIQQVEGEKKLFEVKLDKKNGFELNYLAKGKYRITPSLSGQLLRNLFPDFDFEISGRGCYNTDIHLGRNDIGLFYYF